MGKTHCWKTVGEACDITPFVREPCLRHADLLEPMNTLLLQNTEYNSTLITSRTENVITTKCPLGKKKTAERIALALLLKTQTPHFIAVKRHINLFKDHLHLRRPRRRKDLHLRKSTSSKAHNKTQLMAEPLTLIVEMLHLTSKKFQELKILGGDSYAVYFRAEGCNLIGHI